MFLTVEWAKRWLPAIFLLLSLFLPWWTMYSADKISLIHIPEIPPPEPVGWEIDLRLSFPWMDYFQIKVTFGGYNFVYIFASSVRFYEIPPFCFVFTLILLGGLCGLSSKTKTRILGGLLGIAGIASYFIFVFPKNFFPSFPYFGLGQLRGVMYLWFLSVGFYLALVGSLMLLSPIIRTGIERIRKRQSSSEQTIKEPNFIDVK
jgi:hypothetical protein